MLLGQLHITAYRCVQYVDQQGQSNWKYQEIIKQNVLLDEFFSYAFTVLIQTYAPFEYKAPPLLFAKKCCGGIFISNLSPPRPYMENLIIEHVNCNKNSSMTQQERYAIAQVSVSVFSLVFQQFNKFLQMFSIVFEYINTWNHQFFSAYS